MESVGQPLKSEGKTIPGERRTQTISQESLGILAISVQGSSSHTNCQYECICNISCMPFSCISVYHVYTCVNAPYIYSKSYNSFKTIN